MSERAEKFYELFGGLRRAHGTYRITADGDGKQTGVAKLVHGDWTSELWDSHLDGKLGLGIVPINDENICRFGCIDVDDRTIDHKNLEKLITDIGLPLIVCRSKSGGAHCFFFCKDLPAEHVRNKLADWAIILGYSGVEIFPKQATLANKKDWGSWLNMPYFNAEQTNRYATHKGKRIELEAFYDLAVSMQLQTLDELNDLRIKDPTEKFGDMLEGMPPCLVTLCLRGFGEGSRNNGLFSICVYLRKRYGDLWKDYVLKYNETFFNPPLTHTEVTNIIKSVSGQKYSYKCKDEPICSVCARQVCYTRKFGVGDDDQDPGVDFGNLIKVLTDPVSWFWDVNGHRVFLEDTRDLMAQARFQRVCIDSLTEWPDTIKGKSWSKIVKGKLAEAVLLKNIVTPPEEQTPYGVMKQYLKLFLTDRGKATTKEDMLNDLPWTDENRRTWFSAFAFGKYLEQQRVRISEKDIYHYLRRMGGENKQLRLKGVQYAAWNVAAFEEQTEPHNVPDFEEGVEM